jgi:hypothetical protein
MALSESDSDVDAAPRDNTLKSLLDANEQVESLSKKDVKATYVRVRLSREAMGEFDHGDIVDWLADPCDDYLGRFAQKLGLDICPWTENVTAELWDRVLNEDVSDEKAVEIIRDSLKDSARESVGTPDAKVLNQMLDHYADG